MSFLDPVESQVETLAPPAAEETNQVPTAAEEADYARWAEVFEMLDDDQSGHYAFTVVKLKRRGDDLRKQLEALQAAEVSLLQAAQEDATDALAKVEAAGRREPKPKHARLWGRALWDAADAQASELSVIAARDDPPFAATELALQARREVTESLEAEALAQAELQAHAVAQAQLALEMEAEAQAQAQAMSEVQAQALQVAELQQLLGSEANASAPRGPRVVLPVEQVMQKPMLVHDVEMTMTQEQKKGLRMMGLNSKGLPMKPGLTACQHFLRTGQCRYGRACKWDHPEMKMNSKGYPLRPGLPCCQYYARTGICKYSQNCRFDHPETLIPTDVSELGAGKGVVVPPPAPPPPPPPKVPQHQPSLPLHLQEEQQQMLLQQFKSEIEAAKMELN